MISLSTGCFVFTSGADPAPSFALEVEFDAESLSTGMSGAPGISVTTTVGVAVSPAVDEVSDTGFFSVP
jgi:hypothetical protein